VSAFLFAFSCTGELPSGFAPVAAVLDWIRQNTDVDNWPCNKH